MSSNSLALCACEATVSSNHSRSSKLLKGLVRRSRGKSLSPTRPQYVENALDAFHKPGPNGQACTVCAKCPPRPHSWNPSTPWKRRVQTPAMDDYLTFAQLEESLDRQEIYIGCFEVPQQVTQYAFNDAAEVPVTEKDSVDNQPTRTYQVDEESKIQLSHLTNQNNPAVIDGVVHPALRESTSQPIPSIMINKELSPMGPQSELKRLAVPVPGTNWTYGR